MSEVVSNSIPYTLLKGLPSHILTSGEMTGWATLNDELEELNRQSAVLCIREWFAQRPQLVAPFQLVVDTSNSVIIIHPSRSLDPSSDQLHEVQAFADHLYSKINYHSWPVINQCIVVLNALCWDRKALDTILVDVLDTHTKIGGRALFALVDASKLQGETGSAQGITLPSRL